MKYVLGIDFGGGASKATLLSMDGKVVGTNTVEYKTSYPKPGYCEQDPTDWYEATKASISALTKKCGVDASDIECIGLDAATHTAVLMDADFNVLMPAIHWTDSRSTKEVAYLKENYGDLIYKQALHAPDTIWTLPQLMWVRDNMPAVWAKTEKILFAKDYVRHMLTGDYVTDNIEAQGSMLFDYTTNDWSPELCGILGFDIAKLPKLVTPDTVVGSVTAEAAKDTGLAEGTKVICGTTDTVMEVFAAGGVAKGDMTLKLATAGRICVITDRPCPSPYLINYSHIAQGLYYPGTATKSCAASYRWYRDTFGGDYAELDEAAAKLSVGAEGLMFHPYLNGELTPYADPALCGSFVGIRAGHTKAHFSRAVMEGVALSLLDCKNALESEGLEHKDYASAIGGGAKSPLWRQIVSDALGLTLVVNKYSDSSFGTAMLAGVAAGFFADALEAQKMCNKETDRTEPNSENTAKYAEIFKKYKAVHDALAPVYHNF